MSPTPRTIGEFTVERSLGSGLLGDVYLCKTAGDVIRAVKTVNPKRGRRLKYSQRFIHEISDENIGLYVSIDFDGVLGHLFIMDYLEVRSVSRAALRRTLSREFLGMVCVVAEKLAAVHQKGVLHGNIKTSNFLLRRASLTKLQPILSDFGVNYVWDPTGPFPGLIRDGMAYMAPERIKAMVEGPDDEVEQAKLLTPAADLYSMTCVIVEALTGMQVFRRTDTVDGKLTEKKDIRHLLLNINFPVRQVEIKKLNEFIARNLSVEPGDRVQDGRAYAAALRECIGPEPEYGKLLRETGR
jgi:serine/threonine protein kinase